MNDFEEAQMNTNQGEIAHWFSQGQMMNATHLIVVYDASTGSNFPVYVMPGEKLEQKRKAYDRGTYSCVTDLKL